MPEVISNLFSQYAAYFFLALFAVNVALAFFVFFLQRKIKTIFRGESMNLDNVLLELRNNQGLSGNEIESVKGRVATLEEAFPRNIRRVGLVRHNPFSDAGGNQSFALALLSDKKDGIVISSLYGRSINRVYAKPIEKGKSKYNLSEEEKEAIAQAFE